MASSYPTSVKSFSAKLAGQTISAAHVNDIQDETVAVEGALLNGFAHALKPSSAGAQDLGTSGLPWGTTRTRALNFDAVSTLTIASGAVVATRSHHAVDTEGAAAADDLDTITATGLTDGFVIVLRPANVAHVVTLKDGSGNLLLNGDYALSATDRTITLMFDGTNWRELARSTANATGSMTLLYTASGTDTNASAADFASYGLASQLTQKDSLRVVLRLNSQTQVTASPSIRNATDPVTISTAGSLPVGNGRIIVFEVHCDPFSTLKVLAHKYDADSGEAFIATTFNTRSTFTTAWTGAWTLAMRHGGVTAGGTLYYSVDVYRIAGQ